MIERHVYFKLKDAFCTEEHRVNVAAATRCALAALPRVSACTIGLPADAASLASWDIAVRVCFESIDDVEAYRVHADHRAFVADYLGERVEVVKAWNFLV